MAVLLASVNSSKPQEPMRAPKTLPVHSCSYIQEVTSGYGPKTNTDDYGSGSVPVTGLSGPVTDPQ